MIKEEQIVILRMDASKNISVGRAEIILENGVEIARGPIVTTCYTKDKPIPKDVQAFLDNVT